jgi:hypothetical protein
MHYEIDLTRKSPAFRIALEEFLKQPCVKDGVYCEFGSPIRGDLDITWWFRRMREVNMDRVCCRLINPVWSEDSVSFTCEPYGPFAETFVRLQTEPKHKEFSISVRKHETTAGKITNILAFDMIDATRHIDYNPQ